MIDLSLTTESPSVWIGFLERTAKEHQKFKSELKLAIKIHIISSNRKMYAFNVRNIKITNIHARF